MFTNKPLRFFLAVALLAAFVSCNRGFDKEKFLSECQFSIEDNLLSDEEEYNELYSGRYRNAQTDSLYKRFHETHDYETNLKICRSFGKDYFMRGWGRGTDSLLIDNFFARAINSSNQRDEIIELVLIYGWDKPYECQKIIGETCLKPEYYVNDSLKYIALNYAIDGVYFQESRDLETLREYSKERMKAAASVFGEDSEEAYYALFECAQFSLFDDGKETEYADSLFRYHQSHNMKYRDGRIPDLNSDPLYLWFKLCVLSGEIERAFEILRFLDNEVVYAEEGNKAEYLDYAESKVALMYDTARLLYLAEHPDYESWLDGAIDTSISYLSPTGGYTQLIDYLGPDHRFRRSIVDLMDEAYNTDSAVDAYNVALFIKGTSSSITPDLIKTLKVQGNTELVGYVDSLRQNYTGYPFSEWNIIEVLGDSEARAWIDRENKFEGILANAIAQIDPASVWQSCQVTAGDVYNALRPSESAVEIVKAYSFDGGDVYDALIINYGQPEPIRKRICVADTLSEMIQRGHIYDSEEFYKAAVLPFISEVTGRTVYLSPCGLFNLINIPFISDEQGDCLADSMDIRMCVSTKVICEKPEAPKTKYSSIALFGGMEYELGNHISHYSQQGTVARDVEREGFGYLPATLDEVKTIHDLATQNNIRSSLFTGDEGSEINFKSLSGKSISIIHVATHGFIDGRVNKKDEDALDRCGLLFSNSQDAWKNGIDLYDSTNGILLGSEIANLDLLETDLVVLSACNTGLGEITNEGVYGLFEAFKRAGVKSILMTLGKVDDEATAFFMNQFYESLFSGMDKHMAYSQAVKAMRESEKYKDPKYWAQFVLID